MTPRTRALVVDFSLGAVAVALGVLAGGLTLEFQSLALGSLGVVLFVGVLLTLEQHSPLQFTARNRLVAVAVAFLLVLGCWGGLVLWALADAPAGVLLVGTGLGLVCYRAVFGVYRPLPDRRLAQADLLSRDDDPPRPE